MNRCQYQALTIASVKAFGICHAVALHADGERRNPMLRAFYGLPPGDSPLPTEEHDYGTDERGLFYPSIAVASPSRAYP